MNVIPSSAKSPNYMGISKPIFRYLDSVGNGTGTKNMATTADDYLIQPDGEHYQIHRMLIQIVDGANFATDGYGAGAALATGISLLLKDVDGSTVTDLMDGVPITNNEGWARQCYDTAYEVYGGGGTDRILNVRWTFERAGAPFLIENGQSLVCQVPDDLTFLTAQYMMVQGKRL